MSGEAREKCAVVGLSLESHEDMAAPIAYEALKALQHRGTEAAGIASCSLQSFNYHRGPGMVQDVFSEEKVLGLIGNTAIGQNRYSTNGAKRGDHVQPVVDEPLGFAFGHNGNLPVTDHLTRFLDKHGVRNIFNDSEMMSLSITQYLRNGHDLPDAVELATPLFKGSFSCVAMHDGVLVAFRDNRGIRPFAMGRMQDGSYMVASETCALDIVGAEYEREIEPGEMVIIQGGDMETRQLATPKPAFDIFELVYFARRDSKFNGESIDQIRRRFGEQLAEEHPPLNDDTSNILVTPVPDTSIPAAEAYAKKLGLEYAQAIEKNRYAGRTFMDPTQEARQHSLARKHTVIPELIKGRDITVVDDSIVRLNTMPRLYKRLKAAGAKSVRVLISSPPVRYPDFYGIDTPSQNELIAAKYTPEEIREIIGCEYLGYLSLSGMVEATGLPFDRFNLSCFNGFYPISIGERMKEIRDPVSMEYAE